MVAITGYNKNSTLFLESLGVDVLFKNNKYSIIVPKKYEVDGTVGGKISPMSGTFSFDTFLKNIHEFVNN